MATLWTEAQIFESELVRLGAVLVAVFFIQQEMLQSIWRRFASRSSLLLVFKKGTVFLPQVKSCLHNFFVFVPFIHVLHVDFIIFAVRQNHSYFDKFNDVLSTDIFLNHKNQHEHPAVEKYPVYLGSPDRKWKNKNVKLSVYIQGKFSKHTIYKFIFE